MGKPVKRILMSCCLLVAAFNCNAGDPAENGSDEPLGLAKDAIKTLAGTLQSELKSAMQTGGPTAAIEVCKTRALELTQQVGHEKHVQLARVSLKNRNPANSPNHWQAEVLQDFERQLAQGHDINTLTWSETTDVDGSREYRFMKAIPTAGVCLACHGTALSPEISQVLNELYPEDKATGFSEGDIRGAFVVTKRLAD
jgi:hypothetical protein